ncbi:MAG TPA: undecaprenyl-diphosphate phosphatase [candidate division Zixibacteria bacterium]|nr:undecaprenyl-diphosphate phosphatase [candidate division Zixibacteria bacterium]
MNYIDTIILGLIQGLTEFLPVSSSGHLVLGKYLLGAEMSGIVFELAVHFGTLMSVLIYFRKRVLRLVQSIYTPSLMAERKMILYLILGMIPAVIIALIFKDQIESVFSAPLAAAIFLVVTGIILILTAAFEKGLGKIDAPRSLLIGFAQALAILPGISRSGMTISAGLFTGVKPIEAAEYSFLLSIPAIIGAIIFQAKEIVAVDKSLISHYLVGAAVAFLSGLFAVYLLLDLIRKGKFKYFGIYCILMGILGIVYFI